MDKQIAPALWLKIQEEVNFEEFEIAINLVWWGRLEKCGYIIKSKRCTLRLYLNSPYVHDHQRI
jgi:hypothetical protein